jgi:ubiquinone/menaquinone biosynthesis C-methylase UbiE
MMRTMSKNNLRNENVSEKVRMENISVHQKEANIYDLIHPELYGNFEQSQIKRDLNLISDLVSPDGNVKVLDVGCGTGNLGMKFLELGYSVKAVDISPEMIDRFRLKLIDSEFTKRVEFTVGDAEEIIQNARTYGSWDIVSFGSVLHHLPNYLKVIHESFNQLRPGGVLYICHEPLSKQQSHGTLSSVFLRKTLSIIDTIYIYFLKMLIKSIESIRNQERITRTDYSFSDYHAKSGINIDMLLHEVELAGGRILLFETYCSRFSSSLAYLDNKFALSEPTHFRIIIQR